MLGILIFIEPNAHGESLDNFHVVPGRIFRREQAEKRTGGARQALHFALIVASESVDADRDGLAGSHPFELRLFEVCRNPDIVQGNDHKQALSRLDTMSKLNRFSSDHAAYWRVDFGVLRLS